MENLIKGNQIHKGNRIVFVINTTNNRFHGTNIVKSLRYLKDNEVKLYYNKDKDIYFTVVDIKYPVNFYNIKKIGVQVVIDLSQKLVFDPNKIVLKLLYNILLNGIKEVSNTREGIYHEKN